MNPQSLARLPQPTHRKSFALVELLTVMAVVAILASLLVPSFISARSKARAALCVSNQRQISIAYITKENNDKNRLFRYSDSFNAFWPVLKPYGISIDTNFCPETQKNRPVELMNQYSTLGNVGWPWASSHPLEPRAVKLCSTGSETLGSGTSWDHLVHGIKAVSGQDWQFHSFPVTDAGYDAGFAVLRREVESKRPALVDLGAHTVVFAGYDAEKKVVYIQNPAYPWPGVHTLSYEQFRATWHSPWHVSTSGGIEARPILLTPSPKMEKT